MATPTVRELVKNSASNASATVNTGAGTAVGDILLCFYGSNYYTISTMGSPTPGTWGLEQTADAGLNLPHLKLFSRSVTTGGANEVTVPANLDAEIYQQTFVLAGVGTTNENSAGNSGTGSSSHVSSSVTAVASDDLLLCVSQAQFGTAYTAAPSGMTNLTNENTASFGCLGSARQNLTVSPVLDRKSVV